jgi:hypothetical protein
MIFSLKWTSQSFDNTPIKKIITAFHCLMQKLLSTFGPIVTNESTLVTIAIGALPDFLVWKRRQAEGECHEKAVSHP